jgi:hypothetical protein
MADKDRGSQGDSHSVVFRQSNTGFSDTKVHGMEWELVRAERNRTLAMLDMGEPLLFDGCNNPPVLHDAGCGIVEGRVDTKGVQGAIPPNGT